MTMATKQILVSDFDFIYALAARFAQGNKKSVSYDLYVNVGIDALAKAYEKYEQYDTAMWETYLYRCIKNAMINEQIRSGRHELEKADGVETETIGEVADTQESATELMVTEVRRIIRKWSKNERNALMVEMFIGLDGERVPLKDIAEEMNLSHESVRLVVTKTIANIKSDANDTELIYSFVG